MRHSSDESVLNLNLRGGRVCSFYVTFVASVSQDSTTVDFAYHVHTDVGNQMVGAKVNGKLVNPEHLVQNAEVIEVLTYNGPATALAVSRHFVSSSIP